jgi:hypothetical protein
VMATYRLREEGGISVVSRCYDPEWGRGLRNVSLRLEGLRVRILLTAYTYSLATTLLRLRQPLRRVIASGFKPSQSTS